MLGLDLCRVNSYTWREKLLELLGVQSNEIRFPLGMCPLSPEYPNELTAAPFFLLLWTVLETLASPGSKSFGLG